MLLSGPSTESRKADGLPSVEERGIEPLRQRMQSATGTMPVTPMSRQENASEYLHLRLERRARSPARCLIRPGARCVASLTGSRIFSIFALLFSMCLRTYKSPRRGTQQGRQESNLLRTALETTALPVSYAPMSSVIPTVSRFVNVVR